MTRKKAFEEAKRITQQLVAGYRPQKVILFGSAVRSDGPEPNDLDFLIVKQNVPENGLERIRDVDRLIQSGVAVDFFVMKPTELEQRINLRDPFITKSILERGIVMYGG